MYVYNIAEAGTKACMQYVSGPIKNMTEVEQEIESAAKELNLFENDISLLLSDENRKLYYDLLSTFVTGGNRRWWWEDFKAGFSFKDFEFPFEHLHEIIPDLNANVWLMVEDIEGDFYPIYDIKPILIKEIIGNCFGFEYYIIPKDKSWLICENHHNRLIGIGDKLKSHNQNLIETQD